MSYLVITNMKDLKNQVVDVNDDDVEDFLKSREILVKMLDMEVIYDQLIETYWDYKNKVDYWKLRSLSKPLADYNLNHEIRSSLNRLAFNLLNVSKLYLDKSFHRENKVCFAYEICQEEDIKLKIDKLTTKIYDENVEYVIAYKLRNYTQHGNLPVRGFTTGVREKVVSLKINYTYDQLIKLKVPKSRIDKSETYDLTQILDGYIYGLSSIHKLNRELVKNKVYLAKLFINKIWRDLINNTGYESVISELFISKDYSVNLGLDWFEVCGYLQSKHRHPINYKVLNFG